MFNFTSLLGAQSSSRASQSLLEFDGGIQILIDVGWDESFDVEKLKEIEKHVPTLSFILLTHATTAHLGAYVHCCKNFPLFNRIPVYATNPVISLGRTLLQDLYESTPLASSIIPTESLNESAYSYSSSLKGGSNPNILLQAPSTAEIADYFARINPLRYSQPHQPIPSANSPPLNGLTITAYSAGHTLGGSIWHIQHGMESVVYAVDWNQAREHVLSGAAWLGGPGTGGSEVLEQLRRPTALICSSRGTGLVKVARAPNKRDAALLDMIRDTVANGGSVLIPTDSSARILELSYLLEETWQKETTNTDSANSLRNAKLYLASRTGGATMRYVRSMLEWMEEGIVKEFEAASGAADQDGRRSGKDDKSVRAPFDFKHITLVERKTRVTRMLNAPGPRVILASDTTLEWGFSNDAIRNFAADDKNLIVLTEKVGDMGQEQGSVGQCLWQLWNERNEAAGQDASSAAIVNTSDDEILIRKIRTVALEGDEVPLYQQFLASQRQRQTTMGGDVGAMLETSADVVDDRSSTESESSQGSEDGFGGKALNATVALQHARNKLLLTDAELGINVLIRRKNVYDYEVQGKKGKEKVFPYQAKRRRADDFGELIRPEDFARAEKDDNIAGDALQGEGIKQENAVGQKRTWDDLINSADTKQSAKPKRRTADGDGSEGSQAADSDSEPEEDSDKIDGPSKVIIEIETLELKCRLSFVDFTGLHDQRTIQQLLPLIKPRKLIFIGGEEAETLELAEFSRKALNVTSESANAVEVFAPKVGDAVDASVDTNAWTVKLSRGMVRNLRWQNVRGLGVVAITGRLAAASLEPAATEEETPAKKKARLDAPTVPVSSQVKSDTTPVLDVVPNNMATAVRSVAQPFHVGDLRLADLRKLMNNTPGMHAEFRGEGILVINGVVAVRKTATGQIEVDGGAYGNLGATSSDAATFHRVKRQIYDGLAVVAGG